MIINIIQKKYISIYIMVPTTQPAQGKSLLFTTQSPKEFLVLIWSISEIRKEPSSVFQAMFFILRRMDLVP